MNEALGDVGEVGDLVSLEEHDDAITLFTEADGCDDDCIEGVLLAVCADVDCVFVFEVSLADFF